MSGGIKITVNYDKDLLDIKDLARHIVRNAEFGADKALDKAVDQLRTKLRTIVNQDIKTFDPAAGSTASATEVARNLNIPKSKNDLIKHIFGQDLKDADFYKKSIGDKTVNDNSNVFVVENNRIKAWQSVSDGSTLSGEESKFRNRLINGIIIDKATGAMYKINPKDVKGIKLECSKDTGQTLDSEKKFDAYKNSEKISRRKEGPDGRLAVWTVRQEDVNNMMRHAVSIDDIIERIIDNDYDTAQALLQQINTKGELHGALEKIRDLKDNKNLTPDMQSYLAILKLIANLKIEKKIGKSTTRYTLFSNYDSAVDKNEKFTDALRQEIGLWLASNQDDWFKQMVDQVVKALESYDSKAKFK